MEEEILLPKLKKAIGLVYQDGVPMIATDTIADVCGRRSNNVYRTAKLLAEKGIQGIIVYEESPRYCYLNEEAFAILAKRFYRIKDEDTKEGIDVIKEAFEKCHNDEPTIPEPQPQDTTYHGQLEGKDLFSFEKETYPTQLSNRIGLIRRDYIELPSGLESVIDSELPTPSVLNDNEAFENASLETKVKSRIEGFISATNERMMNFKNTMFDALRDVVLDIIGDVKKAEVEAFNAGAESKEAEYEALRSQLDALIRMIRPEKAESVQTLSGNVSVQQCAAWLTSNGIKNMGEIRLYEWMRQNGLVCTTGTSRNLPTQSALEKGLLVSESNPYTNPKTGERINSFTTRVTPKGQTFLFNRLKYNQENPKNEI